LVLFDLLYTVVFCWEGRLKGICDHYASQGYYVIMPDVMRGDSMSKPENQGENQAAFFGKWGKYDETDSKTLFEHIANKGITEIGAIGFCYGAWLMFKMSAHGFPLKAGASCHPSIKLEDMMGGSTKELARAVNCPMSIASAGDDPANVKEGGEVTLILQEKFPASQARTYPAMAHGWVTRGDVAEEGVAADVRAALDQCDEFLRNNL
jgi:dienelactone hydrolase